MTTSVSVMPSALDQQAAGQEAEGHAGQREGGVRAEDAATQFGRRAFLEDGHRQSGCTARSANRAARKHDGNDRRPAE